VAEGNARAGLVTTAAGVPLHRQLYLVLQDEIARGALTSGQALPTELALCEQFGVSRITVRRALADLAEAGLVDRRHGVGTFVNDVSAARSHDPGRSYLDGLTQVGFESDVDVLEFEVRTMPPSISGRLGPGERGLYVQRLRRARRTGEPLMLSEVWLPESMHHVLSAAMLRNTALYQSLHDAGVQFERMEHELSAEVAGPRVATLLGSVLGAAVIRITTVVYVAGRPHHVLSIAMSPNRSRVLLGQSSEEFAAGIGLAIAHDVHRPMA
jgi:GntR family transcriptional regulator